MAMTLEELRLTDAANLEEKRKEGLALKEIQSSVGVDALQSLVAGLIRTAGPEALKKIFKSRDDKAKFYKENKIGRALEKRLGIGKIRDSIHDPSDKQAALNKVWGDVMSAYLADLIVKDPQFTDPDTASKYKTGKYSGYTDILGTSIGKHWFDEDS